MNLGERIKEIRQQLGYTQKELAEKSGVAAVTIQQYERGVRVPRLEQLQRVANALNVPLGNLLGMPNKELVVPNKEEKNKKLGEQIKKIRQEKNMTQMQLSEALGCWSNIISGIERGMRNPSPKLIKEIAEALQVPVEYLLVGALSEPSLQDNNPYEAEEKFFKEYYSLNDTGKEKAHSYISDLAEQSKYIQKDSAITDNPAPDTTK